MTLRIMRSPQTGIGKGIPVDPNRMLVSIGLLSAVKSGDPMFKGSYPIFAELQSGQPQLGKNVAAVSDSIDDLNKMLSVVHRLELALSLADKSRAAAICRMIANSAPWRRLTALFDPRRSDERFAALLTRCANAMVLDTQLMLDAASLLAEAEASILAEIGSKERYLRLADIEAENINAQKSGQAGIELSVLYKLFRAS